MNGKLATDATAGHRLAVVLRDTLSRIVLTIQDKPGYGPAVQPRGLEVVFRSPDEPPGEFRVSPDLRVIYDEEGEEIVSLEADGG